MNVDEAAALFRNGLASGRMAQGYVISGAIQGPVRDAVARILQMLFCMDSQPPCGQCAGCRQAGERAHPDLTWVEPEKKSRVISVAQMRVMQQRMQQTSFSGGWKACVIYAADRLNAQAANAFLKLLEEPPEKTLFLLLTDSPQFLLPTIVSRCQRISIAGAADALRPEWRDQTLAIMTEAGGAGPVTAMALAERLARLLTAIKAQAAEEVKAETDSETVEEETNTLNARVDARYKEKRKQIVLLMLSWYRDVLMATVGMEDAIFEHADYRSVIQAKAARLTAILARNNVSIAEHMNRLLERNVSESMALNMAFGAWH